MGAVVPPSSEKLIEMALERPQWVRESSIVRNCLAQGYAPKGYTLADFSIIEKDGVFHLFHIPRVPGNSAIDPCNEHWLGHAVSKDLDTWTTLGSALSVEPAFSYESAHIWAPFLLEHDGVYHMLYTGLEANCAQVICLATCNESTLTVWKRHPKNPLIPVRGFDWHWKTDQGLVFHARDPHVVRVGEHYLMAYTAMHKSGCPAVGGMISRDLLEWEDIGPLLYRPMWWREATGTELESASLFGRHRPVNWLPESVNIQPLADGRWVLIPSQSPGLEYYISDQPYSWHGLSPTPVCCENGTVPVGIEVLRRNDATNRWLTAYFEEDRLFFGILDLNEHPWKIHRIDSQSRMKEWLI